MSVFEKSRTFLFSTALRVIAALFIPSALAQVAAPIPAPVLSSPGGTFFTQQQVFITAPDPRLALRYTLNGSAPTASDTAVPANGALLITQPTTLKVAAFSGSSAGMVATAVFNITGQAAAGAHSSVVLKSDGTVWTAGDNSCGQLGNGNFTPSPSPTQVQGLSDVCFVASGYHHVLALKKDGTVWAWGNNADGELGTGTAQNICNKPEQVSSLSGIIAVAAGGFHSLALKDDGTVWAWGYNALGALGTGGTLGSTIPVQVFGLNGIKAIAAGYLHSLALKSDGSVWVFGNNA
ncbi:MAG: hypothetical protein EBS01_14835, partial [Verrucomicrobia bacterium]|nr:hypothetical protein [Verrucomicrobiota bacterium]